MHFATPVVFEHLTGSFRCFKAFSDVFNTYSSYFQDSRHLPHQATFGIRKESTKVITLQNDLARAMDGDATTEKAEDKISITKEEYDRLKQQAEASSKASSAIGPSPPKKSKSEDAEWAQFMETLAERDIELMDLDPQLRQTLTLNTDLKMKQCQQCCDCQRRFAPSSLQRFPESISVRGMSLGEVDVGMERNEAAG